MWLIAGLGNPGEKFRNTRHNVGFRVIYSLAERSNIKKSTKKFNSLIARSRIADEKIIMAQPLTYMNRSGEAVKKIVDYYKIPHDKIIVVYDDLDLPTGKIRIKENGSAGGHKGLSSVLERLQSRNISRIRIGIGRPENDKFKITDYVLGKFSNEELEVIENSVDNVLSAIEMIIKEGLAKTMNKYN